MGTVSDDLRRALQDPGYTPPRRVFGEMLALLAHPELGERAERALLSAGLPAATYAAESLARDAAAEPGILRLLGRALRAHDAPEVGRELRACRPRAVARRRAAKLAASAVHERTIEPVTVQREFIARRVAVELIAHDRMTDAREVAQRSGLVGIVGRD